MISPILSWLTKNWIYFALVGVGLMWLRAHDAKVRYQVLADERIRQVKAVGTTLDSAIKRLDMKDSLIAHQALIIRSKDSAAVVAIATARRSTQVVVRNLRESLDVAQATQLDSVVAGYERQIAGYKEQIQNGAKLLMLEQSRVASRDSVIGQMRDSLNSVITRYIEAENRGQSQPSLVMKYGPWAIAAAALFIR